MPKLLVKSIHILKKLRLRLFVIIFAITLLSLTFPRDVYSQIKPTQIKSFQVFRIANYLAEDNENLSLCIIGDYTIKKGFLVFSSRSSRLKNSSVHEYSGFSPEVKKCKVAFLSQNLGGAGIKSFISKIKPEESGIITISDASNFVQELGGLIQIFKLDEEYRFSVNFKNVNNRKYKISSKLVEAAETSI